MIKIHIHGQGGIIGSSFQVTDSRSFYHCHPLEKNQRVNIETIALFNKKSTEPSSKSLEGFSIELHFIEHFVHGYNLVCRWD